MWLQQFHRTITDGVQEVAWRGKNDLPPSRARITSPYDPDARSSVKRGSAWDGYKVHFTETCDAQESGRPHLITHVVTADATVGDPVVVDEIHDRRGAKGLLPNEHLMDAGYISAELLLSAPSQHGVRVIGPVRPMTCRTVQTAGYDKASFTIDWDARRATYPDGAHSRYWTVRTRQQPPSRDPNPLRHRDLRVLPFPRVMHQLDTLRPPLTVRPQDQDAVLERVRAEQSTKEWKAVYAIRSGVEGTIHQAVTAAGSRRTRYTGLRKTALAHVLTATAVNLIRLDAWWTGRPLAPTRTSHLAALDLAA
ncbi:transposase [Streptomyces sp. NPDC005722]